MNPSRKGKVLVFGILINLPIPGVTYQFLHYLIGLRKLGFDPYYVEDSSRWVYDPRLPGPNQDPSSNLADIVPILEAHGFKDRWAFRGFYDGGRCYGMTEAQLLALYRDADAFLNVTGGQELREEHRKIPARIYVESDPFMSQVKLAQGDAFTAEQLLAHNLHFSFGENIGSPDCDVPLDPRITWRPTRQPVALDCWEALPPERGSAYGTVTTWQNSEKNVSWRGETYYWTKDREFVKYLHLPKLRPGLAFEMATGVKPEIEAQLKGNGWALRDSFALACDIYKYRDFVRHSRGEFTVAREQYVRPNTGWFSDRTCCYLASGRPAITQETGFSKFLRGDKGLYGFRNMDEVLAAVDAIESDYAGNCRAAREVAEEYFAAEKVVGSLMTRAGLM